MEKEYRRRSVASAPCSIPLRLVNTLRSADPASLIAFVARRLFGRTTEPTPDTRTCFMQQARTRWLSKVELSAEIEFRDSLPKTLVDKHSKRRTSVRARSERPIYLGEAIA